MQRILFALLTLGFVSSASASDKNNQLFECMNASLEINAQCIEQQISNNIAFKQSQEKVFEKALEQSSGREIATISFYPEQFLIEVVAHKDDIVESELVVANRL